MIRADDPIRQFERWYAAAARYGKAHPEALPFPDAMVLSTASRAGAPSARVVLLKGVRDGEFLFFTNYGSRKGRELAANSRAALTFYWAPLERQVRLEGRVVCLSREDSEAYFATRVRGSQLGAWASRQSAPLRGREELEQAYVRFQRRYAGKTVPCPPNWGGYAFRPSRIEFWKAGKYRLHDRRLFVRRAGRWESSVLSP